MKEKQYYIYIITNKSNTTLYTGVTGKPLKQRIWEHQQKLVAGFTKKYNVNKLVYYEVFDDPYSAISREKQIKGGSRKKKIALIENKNPNWKNLYDQL